MHPFWGRAAILERPPRKMAPNHVLDNIRWVGITDIVSPCISRPKMRSIECDASTAQAQAPAPHEFVIVRSNQLQAI
jgi:hypothetical protein